MKKQLLAYKAENTNYSNLAKIGIVCKRREGLPHSAAYSFAKKTTVRNCIKYQFINASIYFSVPRIPYHSGESKPE